MDAGPELEEIPAAEMGPDSEEFKQIGQQIRDMILRDTIREDVLVSAEVVVDQHPAAASQIASQLFSEQELRSHLVDLLPRDDSTVHLRTGNVQRNQHAQRLFEVIGRVKPSLILFDNEPSREEESDFGFSGRLYGP